MTARRALCGSAVLLAVLCTAGCFFQTRTRVGGATGVSADGAGRPVIVVAVCTGQLEDVFLTQPRGATTQTIGQWQTQRVSTRAVSVPVLTQPGSEWTVAAAPTRLRSTTSYSAVAESSDRKWRMRPIEFTVADIAALNSDTVLYDRGRVARADFYAKACS